MVKEITQHGYNGLISSIGILLEEARKGVHTQVNQILVRTYWEIGKKIVEYTLGGISNKLFVSKYRLYLPSKKELEAEVEKLL